MLNDRWYASEFRELSEEECLQLLTERAVGRIAFCTMEGPVVLPVNHVLDGGHIIFRTSPHTELARRLTKGLVAYEVDDFDEDSQTGWSVLVRGSAEHDDSPELRDPDDPQPWAAGYRPLVVRVRPSLITGRRLMPRPA